MTAPLSEEENPVNTVVEDGDGRRQITRHFGWYERYIENVAWSFLSPHYGGKRGGARHGYFTWTIWRLRLTLTASSERNYPCGCWQSWVLWQIGKHRLRLMVGDHDEDREYFLANQ